MATGALVNNDIDVGRRIVAALTRAGIPVTVYLWAFIPQLDEWQFIIASPLVDIKGPLGAYADVNKALQREGVFEDIPLRRIFLKSPSDSVLKSLEKQSRAVPQEAFRVVNESIGGNFVEGAYLYSGSLQLRNLPSKSGSHLSVFYAPHRGRGHATEVIFDDFDRLRRFLEKRLSIAGDVVDGVLHELRSTGRAIIPGIELAPSDLRKLGLA